MAKIPDDNATPTQQWNYCKQEFNDYLEHIPFTRTQRTMIDFHVSELERVFHKLRIAAEDAGVPLPHAVILDHSAGGDGKPREIL